MNSQDIADVLRERIKSGKLKPGQEFPTNIKLMLEFNVHASTIQNAVNVLIREGLVVSPGSGNKRRLVRPPIKRLVRYQGGFLTESQTTTEILELKLLQNDSKIPAEISSIIHPPALLYRTRKWHKNIPIELTSTYIPDTVPIKKLKSLLISPETGLYTALKTLGFNPATCEERLVAGPTAPAEQHSLHGTPIVVRIIRKVFDKNGSLLELSQTIHRADCQEFVYRLLCTTCTKGENLL
jgi:GntR family transcriptional regulator